MQEVSLKLFKIIINLRPDLKKNSNHPTKQPAHVTGDFYLLITKEDNIKR